MRRSFSVLVVGSVLVAVIFAAAGDAGGVAVLGFQVAGLLWIGWTIRRESKHAPASRWHS